MLRVEGVLVAEAALRSIDDSDLDALFKQMKDPESVKERGPALTVPCPTVGAWLRLRGYWRH
jgi:hypothetical protein